MIKSITMILAPKQLLDEISQMEDRLSRISQALKDNDFSMLGDIIFDAVLKLTEAKELMKEK